MTRVVKFNRINVSPEESSLRRYMRRIAGTESFAMLAAYELIFSLLKYFPGGLGIVLRSVFYPFLFQRFGSGVAISEGVTVRQPGKIALGSNVIIDEHACLDINSSASSGITVGDNVILERNVLISSGSTGSVSIGKNTGIGAGSQLWGEGGISIGNDVLIAGSCIIVTVEHIHTDPSVPILYQGCSVKPITIEDGVWLGANVKVLQGVTIGKNSIIGAGALVTSDIPANSIAVGMPAKVIKQR